VGYTTLKKTVPIKYRKLCKAGSGEQQSWLTKAAHIFQTQLHIVPVEQIIAMRALSIHS